MTAVFFDCAEVIVLARQQFCLLSSLGLELITGLTTISSLLILEVFYLKSLLGF
jgi:hypothetical protein